MEGGKGKSLCHLPRGERGQAGRFRRKGGEEVMRGVGGEREEEKGGGGREEGKWKG